VLIDTNTYIGHWAFRRLAWHHADDLLRAMDRYGIDQAWVSSASAILYRNSQAGNEELNEQVRLHRDRLVPFAVINPTYADWEHDLAVCQEEFGCRGVRLYPRYRRYNLLDAQGKELVAAATARNLVISIPLRVEDERQRSWLLDIPPLTAQEMAEVVQTYPGGRFHLVNGVSYTNTALGKPGGVAADFRLEISRLTVFISEEIPKLLAQVGPTCLVFGTGMPFTAPEVPLYKLEVLDAPADVLEAIRWRNALRLLTGKG